MLLNKLLTLDLELLKQVSSFCYFKIALFKTLFFLIPDKTMYKLAAILSIIYLILCSNQVESTNQKLKEKNHHEARQTNSVIKVMTIPRIASGLSTMRQQNVDQCFRVCIEKVCHILCYKQRRLAYMN